MKLIPTKKILNHPQYTQPDYEYFVTKGYTNKEIIAFWDRDFNNGKDPVQVNKYEIDWSKKYI